MRARTGQARKLVKRYAAAEESRRRNAIFRANVEAIRWAIEEEEPIPVAVERARRRFQFAELPAEGDWQLPDSDQDRTGEDVG